ncbi:uncharacterized protein LOC119320731 [Triticum dicoccoides]|uniref:uncharacterized protein LOC119320731 n=1 Tax=Triticum dicoccoides TaxID=85692 RepID=UPI001891459A|nr:uncharacterized protein LOC119320731 [Triticum dicoccoides]
MSPAAAPPLEDENLLSEILLRLPPLPSSLPRASAVCKPWRLLVSNPGFVRRFRRHHRRSPPLLGCFVLDRGGVSFTPTMDSTDRVPAGHFSLQLDDGNRFCLLGCRHGLVLISNDTRKQVLVWDPVTGDQHHIAFPPCFDTYPIHGAVLRAAGEVDPFQVVLVQVVWDEEHLRVLACVYSSETGGWGNLILIPIPSSVYCAGMPAVLVGNSFYWRLAGCFCAILEFDLERQSLAVIQVPVGEENSFTVMRAEGGGLGLLSVSGFTAQLWKREIDSDGLSSWGMGRTIELDKLLSLNPEKERVPPRIHGLAEYNNVVFLTRGDGSVIMLHLESLKFKKFHGIVKGLYHHQFESVYSAGTSIGGGHDGAELLHNS